MTLITWLKSWGLAGLLGGCLAPAVLASIAPARSPAAPAPQLVAQAPLQAETQIRLTRDRLNVRIVNQSSTPVLYVAAGDTPTRSLANGVEVLLRDLRIPASLLFQATNPTTGDRLFYNITVQPEGEANGLRIVLRDGGVNEGRTTVFVDAIGAVFVD